MPIFVSGEAVMVVVVVTLKPESEVDDSEIDLNSLKFTFCHEIRDYSQKMRYKRTKNKTKTLLLVVVSGEAVAVVEVIALKPVLCKTVII